ncbi:DUF6586 family protein [Saccharospirillum impatiens]|uniref:DUF6586 family protein n=1 Tax=Saccharospirillum impatiens TaxID=169438 RepID=UPI00040A8A38|nr:DUF6586 family protein [Saccharospirillum impatiens]
MNRRGLTNALLYQARLMLALAEQSSLTAERQACESSFEVLVYRAWMAALCEAAEPYGLTLAPEKPLNELLSIWQGDRPDAWEFKAVQAGLGQPGHWMQQLQRAQTHWSSGLVPEGVKKADPNRITLVSDDNQEPTNHYPRFLNELQQWVDDVRAQSDHS